MKWVKEVQGELWLVEKDRDNMQLHYRVKRVIHSENSQYQNIMILDTYDFGPTLVLDGAIQTTAKDGFIYNEMISHVPLSIHPDAKNVLIIGGGDCGVAREVVKYSNVEQVDMVEIDERVVTLAKQYLPEVSGNLSDPRVNFHFTDGVEYMRKMQNQYDIIIIDSSDPVGPAVQLFSEVFYKDAFNALKKDGLMVCQSQSPIFNMDILKQIYRRLSQQFIHTAVYTTVVPTYPGGLWSFTLASKVYSPNHITDQWDQDTLYVDQEILRSCFHLPEFIRHEISSAQES